jgi:hypothetical protein
MKLHYRYSNPSGRVCIPMFFLLVKYCQLAKRILILAIIFLLPRFSSNLTFSSIFHPFEQIFIKLWWFHPKSGWKCCTFYFIGATRWINENLQKKHWCIQHSRQFILESVREAHMVWVDFSVQSTAQIFILIWHCCPSMSPSTPNIMFAY